MISATIPVNLILGALAVSVATTALSVNAETNAEPFVMVAAAIRAGAEACNTYSATDLDELRDQQRLTATLMGMDAKVFDQIFEARYTVMRTMLSAATAAELSEVCEDMESFPIDQWR